TSALYRKSRWEGDLDRSQPACRPQGSAAWLGALRPVLQSSMTAAYQPPTARPREPLRLLPTCLSASRFWITGALLKVSKSFDQPANLMRPLMTVQPRRL